MADNYNQNYDDEKTVILEDAGKTILLEEEPDQDGKTVLLDSDIEFEEIDDEERTRLITALDDEISAEKIASSNFGGMPGILSANPTTPFVPVPEEKPEKKKKPIGCIVSFLVFLLVLLAAFFILRPMVIQWVKAGTAGEPLRSELSAGEDANFNEDDQNTLKTDETVSVVPTATLSPTPTKKSTPTPTRKPTITPTRKPTVTPTKRATPTPLPAPTVTPTVTPTPIPTATPIPTKKPTPTPTKKATPTPTQKATPTPTKKVTPTPKGYTVGNTVKMGKYETNNKIGSLEQIEWTVLAVESNRVLLISKYVLDAKSFSNIDGDIVWEQSSIREWLNGDFYSDAFSAEEKGKILSTEIKDGLAPHTISIKDKVFLLSVEEAQKYFSGNAVRGTTPTKYAAARGAEVATGRTNVEWWLRTNGKELSSAATVKDTGSINESGRDNEVTWCGVRPAMWIKK